MYRKYYRTMKRDGDVTETMSLGDWLTKHEYDKIIDKEIEALYGLGLVEALNDSIDKEPNGVIDGDELYDELHYNFDSLVAMIKDDTIVDITSNESLDDYFYETCMTVDEEIESIYENADKDSLYEYIRRHVTDYLGWAKADEIDDCIGSPAFKKQFKEFIVLDED